MKLKHIKRRGARDNLYRGLHVIYADKDGGPVLKGQHQGHAAGIMWTTRRHTFMLMWRRSQFI